MVEGFELNATYGIVNILLSNLQAPIDYTCPLLVINLLVVIGAPNIR